MPSKNLLLLVATGLIFPSLAWCQGERTAVERASDAAQNMQNKQKFLLQYKFQQGEEVRWNVEHVATTKAQISGKNETTSSRTESTKLWKVSSVDSIGNITFVHSVEKSKLWQKIGDDEAITFDSTSTDEIPDEFFGTSEMIGKPLAVITITPSGKVVDRKSSIEKIDFGIGDICTPMPENPIPIGHRWYVPTEFTANDEDGRRLQLKARLHYQLTKIVDGMAYISFRTEVLTPIENDKIRSQLLQKLTDGYIAFDLQTGRMANKEIEWNETVQEYAGPDSFLQYIGKMTEQIVASGPSKSDKPRVSGADSAPRIKQREDDPIIRK